MASTMPLCWDWPKVASLPVSEAYSPTLMVASAARSAGASAPRASSAERRSEVRFMRRGRWKEASGRDAFDEFELAVLHRDDHGGLSGIALVVDGDEAGDRLKIFRGGQRIADFRAVGRARAFDRI